MSPRYTTRSHRTLRYIAALAVLGWVAGVQADDLADDQTSLDRLIEEAASRRQAPVDTDRGWSLAIDNDLFAPTQSDRDYTGGVGLTVSGAQTSDYWWSLDPLLRSVDALLLSHNADWSDTRMHQAVQAGWLSFTPQDLSARDVIPSDRPYASLLFVSAARQYLAPDARSVRYSDLTLGFLGLSLTSNMHNAIHKAVGSDQPGGYEHQISAGGEPTARYAVGGSRLRGQRLAFGSGLLETKTTWELSAGYLTEASYAISTRLGAIDSPWWSFSPERADYISRPSPVIRGRGNGLNELYFWAGAKVRLRAYNAFLQGQFRESDHTFGADQINHVIGEAWIGVTGQFFSGTQVSYAVRYQTAEIRDGAGRRDPVWAGITISHSL